MKCIVQTPCFNEETTLESVLSEIPKHIDGIDCIETLIIDDGSSDQTLEVAKKCGVHHIIVHGNNRGLGNAFRSGIEKSLLQGADIVINTDGDNQYPGKYIPNLVKKMQETGAHIVMGDRQTKKIAHFSLLKKFFQWF